MNLTTDSFESVPSRVRRAARLQPDRLALIDGERKLDYGTLLSRIDRFRAWLDERGIAPDAAIAICAVNSIDYAVAYLAIVSAGRVAVPLPVSASARAIKGMIRDSGATLLFVDSASAAHLSGDDDLPPVERIEGTADRSDHSEAPPQTLPDISPDDIFNIIYSSGTTGRPKGIVQSHRMRDAHVRLASACGYGEGSVTLVSTPLYSNTTLVSFLPTLALGGTAILMPRFDAGRFLDLAAAHRVTHAMLVPVQYQRLLARPDFDLHDLSAFQQKFCTSAPFSAELKQAVLDRWPGGLTEYYGMTEGGGLCILFAHQHPDKLHTVGRPAPDNDIRIIDEAGVELPAGEQGEVVGRSGGMMNGYHNLPEATDQAYWTSPQGQAFMRTGDIGRFDEDGFLILMDRKKDVIISGGFNIYPSDLEDVIVAHPGVNDVAVVGVPSSEWGETPVAFVVAQGVDAETILGFANARLGKLQRLAGVRLIEALPRSAIGKVLKRTLREEWSRSLPG